MAVAETRDAGKTGTDAKLPSPRPRHGADEPAVPRQRLSVVALIAFATIALLATALIIAPFFASLVWALTFAVVARPVHDWLIKRLGRPAVAAALTVLAVALVLVLPAMFLAWQVGHQAADGIGYLRQQVEGGGLQRALEQYPRLQGLITQVAGRVDVATLATNMMPGVQRYATAWVAASVWGIVQILIALFALFFFFRDRDQILKVVRSLLPLSTDESNYLFKQVTTTIHATIYGTVVVAMVQGTLGGLMFMLLGIPAALLWGVAMAVLSIVPSLGSFVIWLPVAAAFAFQGHWGKASLLAAWGALVVGTIDNLLYPVLVGKEMRLHTLAVFLAVIGGLALFGAVGLVLGPAVLAATLALVDIMRERQT